MNLFDYILAKKLGGGGGGGDVPMITRAEWNVLTTAQKQAYNYVAIQDISTGFNRGGLYYGEDYVPIGECLPYSNSAYVICEAFAQEYTDGSLSWGNGRNPVVMSNSSARFDAQEGAVYIKTKTDGTIASVDLEASSTPYTAYMVAKTVNCSSFNRVLSVFQSHSAGGGVMFFGNPIVLSSWADTPVSTGINPNSGYFVCALMWKSSYNNGGKVNGGTWGTRPDAYISGQYVTIARTDTTNQLNQEDTDIYVKYFAVVKEAETTTVIEDNVDYLMARYGIS